MHLGDDLGPQRRRAPDAAQIAAYAGAGEIRERFFSDDAYARRLGLPGAIVPGPMLTAFIEQFLRRELPDWRLERLNTTFRVPTSPGVHLVLHGAVTEHHERADGERLVCDVLIEHGETAGEGDRAVTASATLKRSTSGHGR